MRAGFLASLLSILGGLALAPALAAADMGALIAGATPILPAFTPARPRASAGITRVAEPARITALPQPTSPQPTAAPEVAVAPVWIPPLTEHHLSTAEKAEDLAPELRDAILRIEGLYDPTHPDPGDLTRYLRIQPGTAAMNNVFGDRWHIADTDANVSYAVRYVAQAWTKTGAEPCSAFSRRRAGYGIVEITALDQADCARIVSLRGEQDDIGLKVFVVAAALPVPAFAAPEPGARMTSEAFWAAQRARIEAIKARIAFERQRPPTAVAFTR